MESSNNPFEVNVTYASLDELESSTEETSNEGGQVENVQQDEDERQRQGEKEEVQENEAQKAARPQESDTRENPSEEDSEASEDEDDSEPLNVNPWYAAALKLKESGTVPEDFEASNENTTWEDIEPYYESKVRNKVLQQVEEKLKMDGYTEDELRFARMKAAGVDPEQFNVVNRLRAVASLKGQDEVSLENKVAAIRSMYEFRQIPADEYNVLIENAQKSDDENALDNLFNKSVTFHESNYGAFKENEKKQHDQRVELIQKKNKENQEKISRIFRDKKAGKVSFSDLQSEALKKAIYDRTIQVDDGSGNKVAISEMQKFINDFTNNDELKIELYMLQKYRKEVEEASTKRAKRKIEKELIGAAKGSPVVERENSGDNKKESGGYKLPEARTYTIK